MPSRADLREAGAILARHGSPAAARVSAMLFAAADDGAAVFRLAPDRGQRGHDAEARRERRDELLRALAARHYRVSVNEAAERIEADARRYFAGAAYRLAVANGAVHASERDRPAATFFAIAQLPAEVPSARQLRRLLAMRWGGDGQRARRSSGETTEMLHARAS